MIQVLKAGISDTIQDCGRIGYQQFGVIRSGAMDNVSTRIANFLVGNEEQEAVLELSILGPSLFFQREMLIALCGGKFNPKIAGDSVPLWKPILVPANSILTMGHAKAGSRLVMAVAGGFDVPEVLGSQSTYSKAGIGGFKGRNLQKGDVLRVNPSSERSLRMQKQLISLESSSFSTTGWSVASQMRPVVGDTYFLRTVEGRQKGLFTEDSQRTFVSSTFTVSAQSDRMGYRLHGTELILTTPTDLLSEAVTYGTVQVPANGQPIILMADCQTTGGYPKIAQVISADLPKLAQAKPGDQIQFQEVSLSTAQQLLVQQKSDLRELRLGITLKLME